MASNDRGQEKGLREMTNSKEIKLWHEKDHTPATATTPAFSAITSFITSTTIIITTDTTSRISSIFYHRLHLHLHHRHHHNDEQQQQQEHAPLPLLTTHPALTKRD
ncbi:hypothetical protein E2C01_038506 [Portunus trituberculatus]|uniref:Uncharacterized protein n=1 Tax=Portunus trituberculatus TaxID=210409 RepID=A0A5B7FHE3_PORTR|nr:hypothetical protein [Portunus trituberculatus]